MQYFGGKSLISKELSKFINENYLRGNNSTFVDLFCGSCNIVSKIDSERKIIANDKHKYLISMWKELQLGWIPPSSCSKEDYYKVKKLIDIKPHVSGFIGFGCSFAGKWWGGYAKNSQGTNYCLTSKNSVLNKISKMREVIFTNKDYFEVEIPKGSVVYCDIPYRDTTQYDKNMVGVFDHDKFYEWCIKNKNNFTILVSEYEHNVPNGFQIVWKKESKQCIRNKDNTRNSTTEVLFTI